MNHDNSVRKHFHLSKKHEKESANNFEVIKLKNNKRIRRLKDNEEKQINEEIINNFIESNEAIIDESNESESIGSIASKKVKEILKIKVNNNLHNKVI